MAEQIMFNSKNAEEKDFLSAKSEKDDVYRNGPVLINGQNSFWVLAKIIPDWKDEKLIAEDVKISFQKGKCLDKESIIVCSISCSNALPHNYHSEIAFISDRPFYLEIIDSSGYMYSPVDNHQGSKGKKLARTVTEERGALVGYDGTNGKMRGGKHNYVTVSVKVQVIY